MDQFLLSTSSAITDKMIEGHHHLFQVKKGAYPMTLKSQHECVQRLSNNNFDLSGLSFMAGKDELRLKYIDSEDMSVYVGAKKCDIDLLPPLLKFRVRLRQALLPQAKIIF